MIFIPSEYKVTEGKNIPVFFKTVYIEATETEYYIYPNLLK